ncbi:MAG: HEPN domain-containing protein [Verrucomicrobia bacterium]|nr:HEPN domain-containing protein [Verrucomicrobiota bacterium]MBU4366530.1 HEPN domain-containing protein [Verrucomicrobiota bacterium]
MNSEKYAADLWRRAEEALRTAEADLAVSFDAAASRAYYAAFYAVSALFALERREFVKHSAVHAAVHRDLVKSGRWSLAIGKDYSRLLRLRETGDYGGGRHVEEKEACDAVLAAKRIRDAVTQAHPELERCDKTA